MNVNNVEHFKTNKTPNEITVCLQTLLGHVIKTAGIKVFLIRKKKGSIQEHFLTKLTRGLPTEALTGT